MSAVTRSELLPGVFLTLVPATKFKSSLLSMSLLAPLRQETAAVNALIPYLLRRGSETHPDLQSISAALDLCMAAQLTPLSAKRERHNAWALWAVFWMTLLQKREKRSSLRRLN